MSFIRLLLVFVLSVSVVAVDVKTFIPDNAKKLIPTLQTVQSGMWPKDPYPYLLASQIEQESCTSLTSKKCWSPYSELKTSREYGFGVGQITIARNKDGSERFNTFNDLKKEIPSLHNWDWKDRYDAKNQLIAFTWMMQTGFNAVTYAKDTPNQYAFALVAYNSGAGGIAKDRELCAKIKGCDPAIWWGNVELHSHLSSIPPKGYSISLKDVRTEYPQRVIVLRGPKYLDYYVK